MKTLIVYGSKYGFTRECAEKLSSCIGEQAAIKSVKDVKPRDLLAYDGIVLGSPVYMGRLDKFIVQFSRAYKTELLNRKLGFFICCGTPDEQAHYYRNCIDANLLEHASIQTGFGGELREDKMSFMHRLITKMVKKETEKKNLPKPSYREGSIEAFATEWLGN